jgi:hypothetical protein
MVKKEEYVRRYEEVDWETLPLGSYPFVHFCQADNAAKIGIVSILSDDFDKGLTWLKKSAEHYLQSVTKTLQYCNEINDEDFFEDIINLLKRLDYSIYFSLATGSDEILEQASQVAEELNRTQPYLKEGKSVELTYETDRYFYTKTLGKAVLDPEKVTHQDIKKIREGIKKPEADRGLHYNAGADFLQGIAEKDEQLVEKGIKEIIEWHESENITGRKAEAPREKICIHAIAYVKIARKNSLDPDFPEKYGLETEILP